MKTWNARLTTIDCVSCLTWRLVLGVAGYDANLLADEVRSLGYADAAEGTEATTTRAQQRQTQQVRVMTQGWLRHAKCHNECIL